MRWRGLATFFWGNSGDIIPILVDGLGFLIAMLAWLEYRE